MIPVMLFGAEERSGLSVDEFETRVLQICNEHQANRRAAAFALILHGPDSPQFSKALGDKNYWVALHEISGNALTVFAVFDGVLKRDSVDGVARHSQRFRELTKTYRRVLDQQFGISDVQMPALLFFQVQDGACCNSYLVQLKAKTTEEAYQELSAILQSTADSVKDSVGKIIPDLQEAFSRVKSVARNRMLVSRLKTARGFATSIKELLGWFG